MVCDKTNSDGFMRIALIAPVPPPYGGISNWTTIVLREFGRSEDVQVLPINIAPNKRVADGRTLWHRVFYGVVSVLKAFKRLKSKDFRDLDVVHLVTSGSLALFRDRAILAYCKKRNLPVVYHLHFGRLSDMECAASWEWRMMLKNMDSSSMVIVIDGKTRSALSEYLPERKVRFIGNPIDARRIPSNACYAASSRILMYLGWIVPTKGIGELLDAWELVSDKYPGWEIRLVGPCAPGMRGLVEGRKLARVRLIGELPHMEAMEMLSRSAVLLLPSYTEGFPNVVLEAMCCKVPVIATSVGAIPDLLAEGRGMVVPPKDAESLASAMEEMMSNEELRNTMGLAAHKYVLRHFASSAVCREYEDAWRESIRLFAERRRRCDKHAF